MSGLPDPELFASPGMRAALAGRDISTVYRLLMQAGVAQRVIARATGQSQSEVCEILKGRQVMAYDVLVRIAAGLGVPREEMGLGYGAYAEGTASEPGEEADEDLLRRQFQHLLALAGVVTFGTPAPGVGVAAVITRPRRTSGSDLGSLALTPLHRSVPPGVAPRGHRRGSRHGEDFRGH